MSCRKVVNIIVGTFRNIFNIKTSFENERLKICNKCEHRKHIKGLGDICTQCGCVIKSKVKVDSEKCVDNKW